MKTDGFWFFVGCFALGISSAMLKAEEPRPENGTKTSWRAGGWFGPKSSFTPYVGEQESWPISKGAFVDTDLAIPVYHGYPNRAYEVLGLLEFDTPPFWNRSHLKLAADQAAKAGAEAAMIVERREKVTGVMQDSYTVSTGHAMVIPFGNRAYVSGMASDVTTGSSTPIVHQISTVMLLRFKDSPPRDTGWPTTLTNSGEGEKRERERAEGGNSKKPRVRTSITSTPAGVIVTANGKTIGKTPFTYTFQQDDDLRFVGDMTLRAEAGPGQLPQVRYFIDPNFPNVGQADLVPEKIDFNMSVQVQPEPPKKRPFWRFKK